MCETLSNFSKFTQRYNSFSSPHRQKGHLQLLFRERGQNGLKGQDGTGGTVDHEGHSRHQAVKDSTPRRRQQEFGGSDGVVRLFGVDGSKGDAGGNDGNEQEKGNGNRFRVEISHFLAPVLLNRRSKIGNNALAPSAVGSIAVSMMRIVFLDIRWVGVGIVFVVVVVSFFQDVAQTNLSLGFPYAESGHGCVFGVYPFELDSDCLFFAIDILLISLFNVHRKSFSSTGIFFSGVIELLHFHWKKLNCAECHNSPKHNLSRRAFILTQTQLTLATGTRIVFL